jgi:hypothetical protein
MSRTVIPESSSTSLSREELLALKNLTAEEEKAEREFGFNRTSRHVHSFFVCLAALCVPWDVPACFVSAAMRMKM